MKSPWPVIETLMNRRGIGKKDLAEIAGVGPSAVTKWANGGAIRIQSVHRIAQYFEVDPVQILQASLDRFSPSAKPSETDWKARALDAERKLRALREAIKSFTEVVSKLEGAL